MSYTFPINHLEQKHESIAVARTLPSYERQFLATRVLAKSQPVAELAREHTVSRKFLYQQADKAREALDKAFATDQDDNKTLFQIPVTKSWLRQLALSSILTCHASMRGVVALFQDVLDTPISVGTIHGIVRQAVGSARQIQSTEDLSAIKIGAHDEIFQSKKPVLVGCDVASTYCYLLSLEDARDSTTWGVHLLDLQKKGLQLDHSIADGGKGLRAGQAEAWPDVPCYGDVFHALRDMEQLATYMENRAWGVMSTRDTLEKKMQRAKKQVKGRTFSKKLASACATETQAVAVADDISILAQWMQEDILAVVGPDLETRQQLYDWIVKELHTRESFASHRIGRVRKKLEKGRDNLLAFVADLDQRLAHLAQKFQVSPSLVRALFEAQGIPETDPRRWQKEGVLRHSLGKCFRPIQEAVVEIISTTVRASSIVENLNSRLRNYFFLRKQLGPEYLDLLRFFFNHRRFMRSTHPERQGRSPAEILTGKEHPHWLKLLGFNRFKKSSLH